MTLKKFSTDIIDDPIIFSVTPKKGTPFDTPFEFEVVKPT